MVREGRPPDGGWGWMVIAGSFLTLVGLLLPHEPTHRSTHPLTHTHTHSPTNTHRQFSIQCFCLCSPYHSSSFLPTSSSLMHLVPSSRFLYVTSLRHPHVRPRCCSCHDLEPSITLSPSPPADGSLHVLPRVFHPFLGVPLVPGRFIHHHRLDLQPPSLLVECRRGVYWAAY